MNSELFVRTVVRRLTRFKGRALLMSLGVIVSVLATVLVASLSGTIHAAFDGFIGRIYPDDGITLAAGAGFMGGGLGRDNLRVKDVEAIAAAVPAIVAWAPQNSAGRRDIKVGERNTRAVVVGYSDKHPEVRRQSVAEGEFFTADEVAARARVVLLGRTTARALFGDSSPVGATLFVDNAPYRVRGVLESLGMSPHGDDLDEVIAVPYTVVMDSLVKADFLRAASFRIARAEDAESVAEQIRAILRQRHDLRAGQRDDFTVVTPRQMHQMVASTFRTLNVFVVLICAAAFVVSALVLLAVMLASVRQRTAEIGLRKAVGADLAHIRDQVIAEVTVIAAAGCAFGIMLAYPLIAAIGPLLAARFGFAGATISLNAVAIATSAALITGVLGALWPALRAARLNPVDALRMH
jgi:putative ABC transport system permease protein